MSDPNFRVVKGETTFEFWSRPEAQEFVEQNPGTFVEWYDKDARQWIKS